MVLNEMSIEDAFNRVTSLVAFKGNLAKHGVVTGEDYQKLKSDMLMKMALSGDPNASSEALYKLGYLENPSDRITEKGVGEMYKTNPKLGAIFAEKFGFKNLPGLQDVNQQIYGEAGDTTTGGSAATGNGKPGNGKTGDPLVDKYLPD